MRLFFNGRSLRTFLCVTVTALSIGRSLIAQTYDLPGTWRDARGNTHTRNDLDTVLQDHRLWLESKHHLGHQADLQQVIIKFAYLGLMDLNDAKLLDANLTGSNLSSSDLRNADLSGANLTLARLDHSLLERATLNYANMAYADLNSANLLRALLSNSNLFGASLCWTRLNAANLSHADMRFAQLKDADLSFASIEGANLSGAYLDGTGMAGAKLDNATLVGSIFEPKSLPGTRGMASVKGLDKLTYITNPDALFQLRKELADGGFREQEKKITYAIKRRQTDISKRRCLSRDVGNGEIRPILWSSDSSLANCGSFILNRVFFDLTCQYSMSSSRPLILGGLLWLLCSVLYSLCIHIPGTSGLYRIYAQLEEDPSSHRRREELLPSVLRSHGISRIFELLGCEWRLLRTTMFFSLMSALNIGFRDINFGRWLRLLTRQEFDIKAVGWARVIAGWQSLLSVYLLALWVLSYFGRPFG